MNKKERGYWTHVLVTLWQKNNKKRCFQADCFSQCYGRTLVCKPVRSNMANCFFHRAMPLVLLLAKQNSKFEGSSQSPGSSTSAAASGFLLMTRSRPSPASIIRGTVKQQSKSLVLTRFTWNTTSKRNVLLRLHPFSETVRSTTLKSLVYLFTLKKRAE